MSNHRSGILISIAGCAGLALACTAVAQGASNAQFLRAGQRVSAHALDERLPQITFEKWLRSIAAPGRPVVWDVNDCGEQSGSPADSLRDIPVCAEATVTLDDSSRVILALCVGTVHRGIVRPFGFYYIADSTADGTSFIEFDELVTRLRSKSPPH